MDYSVSSILSLISHIHSSAADFTNRRLSQQCNFVSSQGFILYQLAGEEKLTMGEISRRINRDKSTTTVLVKKLKTEGLVTETSDEKDNRVKFISLTDKGREYNQFTAQISKDLINCCYTDFSDEEKNTLLRLLTKMNDNLSEKK